MGTPVENDDLRTRTGLHTGTHTGRIRIGLYIRRDERIGKGPWYWVTCDCGHRFTVRADAVFGPHAARGCKGCRREAARQDNIELEQSITRQVSKGQWLTALRAVMAMTPQQKRDFALLMEGRALNYRNVVESITMARQGLTERDREMFRPKSPQELRMERKSNQDAEMSLFFTRRTAGRYE